MANNLKVLAFPAKSNKLFNPYNYILYSAIEKHGVTVTEFDYKKLLNIRTYDIFHMHWPENILLVKSIFRAYRNLIALIFIFFFLKVFQKKIIWTVHNYIPHENRFIRTTKILQKCIYFFTDGFISLSKSGVDSIRPFLTNDKSVSVIPHPHYKGYYNNEKDKKECREILNIPHEKFVFLFLGQIRKYKNVTALVSAFKQMGSDNNILIVAGKVHPEMKEEIHSACMERDNIHLYPDFVGDDKLQVFLTAADIVVAPYTSVFNSGSIFLNLSFGKCTIAPKTKVFKELQEIVGEKWLTLYNGSLKSNILEDSKENFYKKDKECDLDLSLFSPESVALKTIQFYEAVLKKNN